MFEKNSKRGFKYWFAHWCAFQMTALNCGAWRPRFLFHDAEKPWLELFLPHGKVKEFHKAHSRHHLSYRGRGKIDYVALVIDWECSHFTKSFRPAKAREVAMSRLRENRMAQSEYDTIVGIIDRLGL